MIILNGLENLVVQTSAAGSVDWHASAAQLAAATFDAATSGSGNVTTATDTIAVLGVSGKQMQAKMLSVHNLGAAQTITIKAGPAATLRRLFMATLATDEALHYVDGQGFMVLDRAGRVKEAATQDTGTTGQPYAFYKVGTAPEAAGQWYCWAKDTGAPGAWAPGTPGLNGRATDGTLAADNGCLPIRNPSTGANYLTLFNGAASVACAPWLMDVLWVNSGLGVTTTTAQTIAAPVALPARDLDGTTNGAGCWLGVLVTTATTNAGAITNMTASYTNQDGTAGRTATIASFPATAVIGTVVWFQLAAGDTGVRSVQSVTLGTSLVAGAVSIIIARPLWSFPALLANVGGIDSPAQNPGVRLYNGTCALPFGLMSATTATVFSGYAAVMER